MRILLRCSIFLFSIVFSLKSQAQGLWSTTADRHESYFSQRSNSALPTEYRIANLNAGALKSLQPLIPFLSEDRMISGLPFEVPLPDGSMLTTSIVETSIWSNKELPLSLGIRTYILINPKTRATDGRITVWKDGINGIIFSKEGDIYINPLSVDNSGAHLIYFSRTVPGGSNAVPCLVSDNLGENNFSNFQNRTEAGDCKKRTYRIAVAATGEYTAWAGSVPSAIGYITITMNIVTAIYKRDVNVDFNLVSNTDIIYTNAATDPYTTGAASSTMLNENQNALDATVGSPNYDVGIVFTKASGGGIAQLAVVCNSGKGRGAVGDNNGTGSNPTPGPQGQWFNGAVAHEIGHQFSATHTFSATNGQCGSNITTSSAWETGGGSTLMSYAGVCTGNFYQSVQDYYFHAGSIAQMQNYILSSATCAPGVTTANQAPTASVAAGSYTIPASTSFVLTVNSTDPNGDALLYTWEQMDAGFSSASSPQPTNTQGPLFRSLPPSSSPTRYFPQLQTLLSGVAYGQWEVLPSVNRVMNFRSTTRDQSTFGGCTAEANVALTVTNSAGPFYVTSQFGATTWVANGTNTASITWDVANTNIAPVNCANVDILFSTDGGYTYPIVLASNTPNDGQQDILIPAVSTTGGRVMVKGSNHVFFSINYAPITIQNLLPVTFLGLRAVKKDKNVLLEWSTATEVNNAYFEVERSENGSSFGSIIGKVAATGNSSIQQSYTLTDAAPLSNWNYYRIKQVDLDGKFSYSNIAAVKFDGKNGFFSVYPNPATDRVTVDFESDKNGMASIEVIDSKGRIMQRNSVAVNAGRNNYTLNVKSLSTGIYILRTVDVAGNATYSKFLKR